MKPFSRRTHVLQWIDRRVGVPICWLLTIARRVGDLFSRETAGMAGPRPSGTGSLLFVKFAEQGSTVLAHGAISEAVARVGRDRVHFLVFEENRFIVDLLGLIPESNVHVIRTRSFGAMVTSAAHSLSHLRHLRIDACVDLEFFSRFSAAVCYLIGSATRVGFHTYFGEGPYRGNLFTHRVLYNPHLHTSATFSSLVRALDVGPASLPAFDALPTVPPALPRFQPAESERADVIRILSTLGVTEDTRLILLNSNASDLLPLRKWNAANYVDLARRLISAFPEVHIAFTGGADEAAASEALAREVGSARAHCLAGRTTLRQLLVLCGLSEVLVTNDSGPAHFAALTEIDVVALFGPETPLLFAASGPRSHTLWAGLVCSPCVNAFNNRQTACTNNVCMQRITVDQVLDKVSSIYRLRAARPASAATT